jgi:hypothetical protein
MPPALFAEIHEISSRATVRPGSPLNNSVTLLKPLVILHDGYLSH